jgi:phosphoribosylanthranilate isomerase
MKIKICGIKYYKDLSTCINLGVDYIGINFYNQSKRYPENGDILNHLDVLKEPEKAKLIAVFHNHNIYDITNILEKYPYFQSMQINNSIQNSDIQALSKKYNIWLVCQNAIDLLDNNEDVELKLIDNSLGSGKEIDVEIPERIRCKFGIAGGINESNITKIKDKYPNSYVIDIASGVENKGVFSEQKLANILKLL